MAIKKAAPKNPAPKKSGPKTVDKSRKMRPYVSPSGLAAKFDRMGLTKKQVEDAAKLMQ